MNCSKSSSGLDQLFFRVSPSGVHPLKQCLKPLRADRRAGELIADVVAHDRSASRSVRGSSRRPAHFSV